jgi:acyl-CoA thioester hydrolase
MSPRELPPALSDANGTPDGGTPHVHVERVRIAMSDVDVRRIHFSALPRFIDRAMCGWLASAGRPLGALLEANLGIPIVEMRCTYHDRIDLDDVLEVRTEFGGIGTTSFRSRYRFTREGTLVAEGELAHVCIESDSGRTVPVPDWLRALATPDGQD